MMALAMTSCADEDSTALLTDGIWNFSNMTTDSEDEGIKTLVAFAKALMTDATLEFQAGGDYIIDSPLIEEPETGTWSLIGDDQLIMTEEGEIPSTANIDELTKEKLSYIQTLINPQTQQAFSATTTWVK